MIVNETLAPESLYIPPLVRPPFVRRMGALATEMGFANAVVETLSYANIEVEVEGDLSPAQGQGLIVAGDHRQRIEPLLVQALMSKTDRDASSVMAMPTSFAGRLIQSSGDQGKDLIVPVIPSGFSAENRPTSHYSRATAKRVRHAEVLYRPKAELKAINSSALAHATNRAATGGAVTIFPTGGDASLPWRRGLGQMIGQLPADARETTQVAVFRPDTFSLKKVVAALALRDAGIRSKKQTVVLRAGLLGTAKDLFGTKFGADDPQIAQQVSDFVREGYIAQFGCQSGEGTEVMLQTDDRKSLAA